MKAKHVSEIQKERALETREKINNWFHVNPFLTAADCSEELGFNLSTISRHVKVLKADAVALKNKRSG